MAMRKAWWIVADEGIGQGNKGVAQQHRFFKEGS